MKPSGTFVKLFLDTLLVLAVIIILAGAFTYHQLTANYQRETRQHQDLLVHIAAEHFQALWPLDPPRVDRICKDLLHNPAMRLTVVAADGAVLGDSEADPAKMSNHRTSDRPEVLAALSGKSGGDERASGTLGIPFRYMAMPIIHNGQVAAAVRLAVPVKAIVEGETFIRNTILLSAALGAVGAVLLGLLSTWLWYAPLRRITRTARRIASGDLSSRTDPSGRSGLTELAAALNQSRDDLGGYLGQIVAQHQDFSTVLSALQEGIIATDVEGRVVLMNQAAGQFLSVPREPAVGKPLASVVQSAEIQDFQEHAMADGTPLRRQFEIDAPEGRRILDVRATRVAPGSSSVCCLLVIRGVAALATTAGVEAPPVIGQ